MSAQQRADITIGLVAAALILGGIAYAEWGAARSRWNMLCAHKALSAERGCVDGGGDASTCRAEALEGLDWCKHMRDRLGPALLGK